MAARVTIMAGGTGGHVFPALAVAQELVARGWDVTWLGTPDSFEARTVPQHGIELDTIASHRLRGQGLGGLLLAPLRLLRAMWQARAVLRRRRPQVVLGMGGFAAGPGGLVSRLLRLPLVIHEQNAIPGLTNRWLAHIATRVLAAFPQAFAERPGVLVTGNPVRAEIAAVAAPAVRLAARSDTVRVLVLGGSLGAQALNETVPEALAAMVPERRPLVRHQAGRGKAEATAERYARHGVTAEVSEFVADMAAAYAWADLVLCRAGALTVTELSAVGVAAILVPYPHAVDDHQTVNAQFLVAAGAAELIAQRDLNPGLLAQRLDALCSERARLLTMALAARALARPDATRVVADVCEEVAR